MKSKWIVVLLVVVVGFVIGCATCCNAPNKSVADATDKQKVAYYTCPMHPSVKSDLPGTCRICGMNLVPVYASDAGETNAPSNTTNDAAVKPYPLDYCLVSGEKLGAMGQPIVVNYQGQEIKFCCPSCPAEFKKAPDKYLKKLQAAEAAAQK